MFDGCLAGLGWSALRPLSHTLCLPLTGVHCSFYEVVEGCPSEHRASIKSAHVNLVIQQGMNTFFFRVLLRDKCVVRSFQACLMMLK